MIKLGLLHIEEFRGIRQLDIDFNYESFAVHGPNGSGKSGVVDAVGFALSGTVARLTGAGTGSVSVRSHAPHVTAKDDPDAARVSLTFKDLDSGQVGTITRTVKDPLNFNLTPDTLELRAALESALQHPEFTLSRRELIKFILAESGKRSEEVQALLQLKKLDDNRKLLRSALTKVQNDKKSAEVTVATAKSSVELHLSITDLTPDKVKAAINPHRKTLGLTELTEVKLDTNLKDGLEEKDDEKPFDKQSALREIQAYSNETDKDPTGIATATSELITALDKLVEGSDLELLKNRSFLESGLELIEDEGICPLCDKEWRTPQELRTHLAEKIESSKELAKVDQGIATKSLSLKNAIANERTLLTQLHTLSVTWSDKVDQEIFQKRLDLLLEFDTLLKTTQGCVDIKDRLEAGELSITKETNDALYRLNTKVNKQPDTSEKVKSRSHIVIAAERWTSFANARANQEQANRADTRAKIVYDDYCSVVDKELDDLYKSVESRFSAFYSKINQDDEGGFKAEFKPSAGKLDLLVDFYGIGMFPPGAYHSEGHQDGMGICLYLALVEKIMGKNFSLSVLDDVVMSVDVNHRRQFCELLKQEFPDTQFILTTHDEIWAKQMQTTGLIKSKSDIRFRGWSVESGPVYEQGQIFWDKIDSELGNDDIPSAAHKLRRGLEAELPDIAESLSARVPYRGDAKYDLGELLSSVKGRHTELLKKAKESASSWNKKDELEKVKAIDEIRKAATLSQDKENWAVNLQVHYNDWASMSKADFEPVAKAWRELLGLFTCTNEACESWIGVSFANGKEESLRCRCGDYNLNLVKKS